MANIKHVTRIDAKYRVPIGRDIAERSGFRKGDRLVVVPFRGGVIIEARGSTKFTDSLRGFAFDESRHEADSYVQSMVKSAHS